MRQPTRQLTSSTYHAQAPRGGGRGRREAVQVGEREAELDIRIISICQPRSLARFDTLTAVGSR